ncbi:MAG: SCP2 sterol-binding domain-containing protein [Smithella sp.]
MSIAVESVKDVFDKLPQAFQPDAAKGVDIIFQFNIGGPTGGNWYVTVKDGACEVASGSTQKPTCTFMLLDKSFMDLMSGKTTGMKAYMTGKLKVSGDLIKSQLLAKLFVF